MTYSQALLVTALLLPDVASASLRGEQHNDSHNELRGSVSTPVDRGLGWLGGLLSRNPPPPPPPTPPLNPPAPPTTSNPTSKPTTLSPTDRPVATSSPTSDMRQNVATIQPGPAVSTEAPTSTAATTVAATTTTTTTTTVSFRLS
jgi:hypothetical protein